MKRRRMIEKALKYVKHTYTAWYKGNKLIMYYKIKHE